MKFAILASLLTITAVRAQDSSSAEKESTATSSGGGYATSSSVPDFMKPTPQYKPDWPSSCDSVCNPPGVFEARWKCHVRNETYSPENCMPALCPEKNMQGYIDCHLCVNKTQSDDVVGGDWDIQFWGGQCLADNYDENNVNLNGSDALSSASGSGSATKGGSTASGDSTATNTAGGTTKSGGGSSGATRATAGGFTLALGVVAVAALL